MKIFRVADEKLSPKWAFGSESLDDFKEQQAVDLERLNVTPSSEVSEDVLCTECKQIEQCAASDKTYHYNAAWKNEHISHLKEYASICGLDSKKFKGIDPEYIMQSTKEITAEVSNARNIKTAAVATLPKKLDLGDPFHLEDRSDTSHMEKTKWQEVKKESKMKEAPVMMGGNIIPIRGGEDYFTNSESKTAKNQNSISDPKAIEKMVESSEEDTGARLKRILKEKEETKKQAHSDWQKDKVASMAKNDIVPKGVVFPTESLNAQPGLSSPSSKMGVYAKFNPEVIPEKTAGEQIKSNNEERKRAIQREEKAKPEFEMSHQSSRKISDVFSEELKKHLK